MNLIRPSVSSHHHSWTQKQNISINSTGVLIVFRLSHQTNYKNQIIFKYKQCRDAKPGSWAWTNPGVSGLITDPLCPSVDFKSTIHTGDYACRSELRLCCWEPLLRLYCIAKIISKTITWSYAMMGPMTCESITSSCTSWQNRQISSYHCSSRQNHPKMASIKWQSGARNFLVSKVSSKYCII